jgi:hypothetical protein
MTLHSGEHYDPLRDGHTHEVSVAPSPKTPSEWLLNGVRTTPWMTFAVASFGLTAAGTISLGFFFSNYLVAAFAGVAIFAVMLVLKAFAVTKIISNGIYADEPLLFLLWAGARYVPTMNANRAAMNVQ